MKKKILIPIMILLIIIILGHQSIIDFITTNNNQQNTTEHMVLFENYRMQFRAPIELSESIQVYPDEQTLKDVFFKKNLEKVQIAIISNNSVNGQYILVSHSLAVDLPLILEEKTMIRPEIKAVGVSSIEEAKELATSESPVIMLLHPSLSNRTAVTVEDNIVFLEGETLDFVNDDYYDLDFAAGKLMLTLMENYQQR